MKVAILGATGETGTSILRGLINSMNPRYEIIALIRPSSLHKSEVLGLKADGIKVVPVDLNASEKEVSTLLYGVDTVISAISAADITTQILLANAAKAAGVKRFVPCCFGLIMPPRGALLLREVKEDVSNHIKKLHLPYTIIDVGFWYQLTLPRLPSGRIDYAVPLTIGGIAGDGNAPSAITDLRDIGRWVACIIADPRTLNKMVFAYNEVLTMNQVYDILEKNSGEKIDRNYISTEAIKAGVEKAEASRPNPDSFDYFEIVKYQYLKSMGLRKDNTPEYAQYLGYLDAKELYPDLEVTSLEAYCREVLSGKATPVYQRMVASAAQS